MRPEFRGVRRRMSSRGRFPGDLIVNHSVEYIVIAAAWDAANKTPPHADGAALPLQLEPEPLRHPGVLRAARVGVAAQSAWVLRGLEPESVV